MAQFLKICKWANTGRPKISLISQRATFDARALTSRAGLNVFMSISTAMSSSNKCLTLSWWSGDVSSQRFLSIASCMESFNIFIVLNSVLACFSGCSWSSGAASDASASEQRGCKGRFAIFCAFLFFMDQHASILIPNRFNDHRGSFLDTLEHSLMIP